MHTEPKARLSSFIPLMKRTRPSISPQTIRSLRHFKPCMGWMCETASVSPVQLLQSKILELGLAGKQLSAYLIKFYKQISFHPDNFQRIILNTFFN